LPLEQSIRLACALEAAARKPGNVHPQASFPDLTYVDFLRAADAAAPELARAAETGVGPAVLEAVRRVRNECRSNVNLGIVLLIAPLAAVPRHLPLQQGLEQVLSSLDVDDAAHVYEAIRIAQPGGMGRADSQDVSQTPTVGLREAMRLAADRDAIAREYAEGYPLVLGRGIPLLAETLRFADDWETGIVRLHLTLMAEVPDTLIARKCGLETAREAARRAQDVLDAGWPATPAGRDRFAEFDSWLRSDGHRRNPGTTADLVAASLFAALREGAIAPPSLESIPSPHDLKDAADESR